MNISTSYGQYYFDRYTNIGGEEEISGQMVEGPDGFIWIGTDKGLYRYDGRNFKIYRHDPADSTSLQADHIYTILAVDDQLWLGTDYGISVFDLSSQTFKNYTFFSMEWSDWRENYPFNRVTTLYQDRQGEIWIGTNVQGFWRFDAASETFVAYSERDYPNLKNPALNPYNISSISQSGVNDSIIWIGTTTGLIAINKYTNVQTLHLFQHEDARIERAINIFRRIYAHTDGLIYVGNWTEGVYTFNPQTNVFQPIQVNGSSSDLLEFTNTGSFYPYSKDQIWISTTKGVVLYNTKKKTIEFSKANDFEENAFYGISMIDKRNRFWYNSLFGIYLFDPHLQQFEEISYSRLYSEKRAANTFYLEYDSLTENLLVCPRRADGIYLYNRTSKAWIKYPLNIPSQEIDLVYGLAKISDKDYLISTRKGLFIYRLGKEEVRKITLPAYIDPVNLRNVLITSNREVWISVSHDGILRTDLEFKEFKHYQKEIGYGDLGLTQVDDLFEDSQQNIWVKRRHGLSVYDRKLDTCYNFIYQIDPKNSFGVVNAFTEDHKGRIWTSGIDGQIGYMEAKHPELGIVAKINIHDLGIPAYVYEMATDSKGNIWGVTSDDLIRVNPEDLSIQNFSLRYGAKDFDFFSFKILPDDEMFLGSWISLLRTSPAKLKKNEELPIPYLSSLSIRNLGEKGPYPLFGKEPLHLKHHQNFFTLFYSAQAYTLGNKVSFRYRLKGFDEWNEVGTSQIATYTNVPSGDYTFELQAANNEGIWNNDALTIPITIDQPWFTSWWFYLIVILFLGLFIFSIYQYRINQIRNEAKLKTEFDKKLAGVEMNALLAQMNPHFIFNSLNSIDSFILKNESRQASEYLNDFARLIRLILQNSRSESIRLSDEIETLELYLKMEQLRFKGKFDYEIKIDGVLDLDQINIPPMLVQPYVENAVWHGIMHLPEGQHGQLEVNIHRENGTLSIQVTDNGVGRVRSREIKQRKVKHKKSMGMQITYDRIDLINTLYNANARIDIADLYSKDKEPKGTKVFITISI